VGRRCGPEAFVDAEFGKEEYAMHESPEVWARERIFPVVVVQGHINEEF
jgi:hypothetical protein